MGANQVLKIVNCTTDGRQFRMLIRRFGGSELFESGKLASAALDERDALRVGHRSNVFREGKDIRHDAIPSLLRKHSSLAKIG